MQITNVDTSTQTRLMAIYNYMPKGVPKNGINKGWFKNGDGFWTGKKRPDMEGNTFAGGNIPWNKGVVGYHLTRKNFVWPKEEKAYHWLGDDVGYIGLHLWVRRHLGKAKKCVLCGECRPRHVHWANLSHEYKRDLTDFVQLCVSHHKLYDQGKIKL